MKRNQRIIKQLYNNRIMIWGLAKNDFKSRFASSMLGGFWGFAEPLMTLLVMWFVFQVALKNGNMEGVPFIIWFAPAFLSWNFFAEALGAQTRSLKEYSYLVKKVNFKVDIVPIIKIISSGFVHVAFIGFILVLNFIYAVPFKLVYFQVFYYLFCVIILLAGLGWLTSSLVLFIPDVSSVVNIVLQIGFWASPIVWNPNTLSPFIQNILKLNPMFYICEGYRDTFVTGTYFWERGLQTPCFWCFTIAIFLLGNIVFNRLRPEFADVM